MFIEGMTEETRKKTVIEITCELYLYTIFFGK